MPTKLVRVEAAQVDGYRIEAKSRNHISIIDQPVASGGADAGPTPLEYLFISLASCMVTIGHIVAKQRRLPVRKIEAQVEGELNTDVFLGKNNEERAGFSWIRVHMKVDGEMSQEEKEAFIHDVDRRCPISDNIQNATAIEFVVE